MFANRLQLKTDRLKHQYFINTDMEFNVRRLAADAGTFLSRAVQVTLTQR